MSAIASSDGSGTLPGEDRCMRAPGLSAFSRSRSVVEIRSAEVDLRQDDVVGHRRLLDRLEMLIERRQAMRLRRPW